MMNATMVVTTVPVTDLAGAKEFYGDTLGLSFQWEISNRQSTTWPPWASSSSTAPKTLVATGHIAQLGPARAAWFHGLDGNILGLRQG